MSPESARAAAPSSCARCRPAARRRSTCAATMGLLRSLRRWRSAPAFRQKKDPSSCMTGSGWQARCVLRSVSSTALSVLRYGVQREHSLPGRMEAFARAQSTACCARLSARSAPPSGRAQRRESLQAARAAVDRGDSRRRPGRQVLTRAGAQHQHRGQSTTRGGARRRIKAASRGRPPVRLRLDCGGDG